MFIWGNVSSPTHSSLVIRHFPIMSALPETQIASPNGSFTADVFAAHLASLSHLPKWWLDLKREAWNRFIALPLPKRTDEFWRFSNTAGIKLDGYEGGPVIPGLRSFSEGGP